MLKEVVEQKYSVEAYFELEKNSETRHEFYYGKLITMPGESKTANQISKNILKKWDDLLETKGYALYNHEIKTQIEEGTIFRYPDIVVAPESDNEDNYVVKQPILMVEVASEESWRRDTHVKRREYTTLPSLQSYLIVSQEEVYVECLIRTDEQWVSKQYENLEDTIEIPSLGISIRLEDIYYRVTFGA